MSPQHQSDVEPPAVNLPISDFVNEVITNANNTDSEATVQWISDLGTPPPSEEEE